MACLKIPLRLSGNDDDDTVIRCRMQCELYGWCCGCQTDVSVCVRETEREEREREREREQANCSVTRCVWFL